MDAALNNRRNGQVSGEIDGMNNASEWIEPIFNMLLSVVREFEIQMWPKQEPIGIKSLQWYAWVMRINPKVLQLSSDKPVWLSRCPD